MSTFIGLALATIGIDLQSGVPRFTMGVRPSSRIG